MRKEIELLKHHADTLAHLGQLGFGIDARATAAAFAPQQAAGKFDTAGGGNLHKIQAAQEGALA